MNGFKFWAALLFLLNCFLLGAQLSLTFTAPLPFAYTHLGAAILHLVALAVVSSILFPDFMPAYRIEDARVFFFIVFVYLSMMVCPIFL